MMNKQRLARRVLIGAGPIVLVLLAVAVFATSPMVAILVVLLSAVFASMLFLLERSLKTEHQQRWMLRSALESRISELERLVRVEGPDGPQPTSVASDLDAYRHMAQALSRIARIERAVGLEASRDGSRRTVEETAR
jgi:hypothetical protein